jgi:hypothetical protein
VDEHGDVVGDDDIGSGGGIDGNISIIMMVLVMMMVVKYSSGNDNDSNGGDNDKYDNGYIIIMSIAYNYGMTISIMVTTVLISR